MTIIKNHTNRVVPVANAEFSTSGCPSAAW